MWNFFGRRRQKITIDAAPGPGETIRFKCAGLPADVDFSNVFIKTGRESFVDDAAWLRLGALQELLIADELKPAGADWLLPIQAYYQLDEELRSALKLCVDSPLRLRLRLRSRGNLSEPEFSLLWSFIEPNGREALTWRREGCFLTNQNERVLLSADEYALLTQLEAFEARPLEARNYETQLARFVEMKPLAVKVGAYLDHYLQAEEAVRPLRVRPAVTRGQDGTIAVAPDVMGVDPQRLGRALDTHSSVPHVLTLQGAEGGRQRLVLSPGMRTAFSQVSRLRRLSPKEREHFLVRPQDYLDPELFDLDDFSARVTGVGRFTPRYCPFAVPGERPWLPPSEIGLTLESDAPDNVPERLPFNSIEEIDEFEAEYRGALAAGAPVFNYADREFPITGDTENMIATLREMLARKAGQPEKEGRWTLIIESNEEENSYVEDAGSNAPQAVTLARPASLLPEVELLRHQAEGVGFLQHVFESKWRGVLLADDMGLGKTLQILTFLAWHSERHGLPGHPILIIAPVALLDVWVSEYRKFLAQPWGAPLVLHGATLRHFKSVPAPSGPDAHARSDRLLDHEAISQYPFVLTTYEAVRDYQFSLCAIDWSVVVLDEAQKIKTPNTLVTNAVKALKADFRIVATGTPVENSLVDLWCLTDFAQPGLLGALRTFRTRFEVQDSPDEAPDEDTTHALRRVLAPVFIRRLKCDVLDLPPRTEHAPRIPMSPIQVQRYREVAGAARENANATAAVLSALHKLRDVMVHPGLAEGDDPKFDLRRLPHEAPKLHWILGELERVQHAGDKCVIFAEKRNIQRLLAEVVRTRFGFAPGIVNGDVKGSGPGVTRLAMIRNFEEVVGFNVIVLSPLAVGFGLTITQANHVIHASRLWNPAKEDQATDRVHRIGQTREVFVHYPTMVAPDGAFATFDEILAQLLAGKRSLAGQVLQPSARLEVQLAELARAFDI